VLSWHLCDLAGNELAALDDRLPGGAVEIGVNKPRTASVPLSLEDPAILSAYPLYTSLKVFLDGAPLFRGPLLRPRIESTGWTIRAVDPSIRPQRFHIGQRSDDAGLDGALVDNPWRWEGVDQRSMMDRLIRYCDPTVLETNQGVPPVGIRTGSSFWLPGSSGKARDREYEPGKQLWEALMELSEVLEGNDFELRPIDTTDGQMVELWIGPLGTDRSQEIVFEYGALGANASDFALELAGDGVVTRSTWTGQAIEGGDQPAVTAYQPEAERAFGIFGDFQGRPDIVESDTLREHAQGVVSTYGWPIDYFEVTPALDDGSGYRRNQQGILTKLPDRFAVPPRFGPGPQHDYWIGDTLGAWAQLGRLIVETSGRLTDARLTEADDAGNYVTELTLAPAVSEAGITFDTSAF
jgi:hypothetical protein